MPILKRTWALAATFCVALAAGGCEPPPAVDSVPPGLDVRETLIPKEEPAEARGEGTGEVVSDVLPGLVPAPPTAKGEEKTTPSGVKYETVKEGQGATAEAGHRVTIHYVGTLDDGRKFDSSRDKGKPESFRIGTGKLIKGWDEVVPGMKVGEVRKMTIPPSAGYGALGKDPIPPNATLHFEVELVATDGPKRRQ